MKKIKIEAKMTDKVTGKETTIPGECKQYDSLSEADKDLGVDEKGTSRALTILNMHVKIRALDALRKGTTPSIMKLLKSASPEAKKKVYEALGLKM